VLAERIERRWLDTLVAFRAYATFTSDGWRRTVAAVDRNRERLDTIDDTDALAREYLAVVLLRRVRMDDPATQPSPFVRDAAFALRYVELKSGLQLTATALPPWLGEWAVAEA
jgi:hypothetical protein